MLNTCAFHLLSGTNLPARQGQRQCLPHLSDTLKTTEREKTTIMLWCHDSHIKQIRYACVFIVIKRKKTHKHIPCAPSHRCRKVRYTAAKSSATQLATYATHHTARLYASLCNAVRKVRDSLVWNEGLCACLFARKCEHRKAQNSA